MHVPVRMPNPILRQCRSLFEYMDECPYRRASDIYIATSTRSAPMADEEYWDEVTLVSRSAAVLAYEMEEWYAFCARAGECFVSPYTRKAPGRRTAAVDTRYAEWGATASLMVLSAAELFEGDMRWQLPASLICLRMVREIVTPAAKLPRGVLGNLSCDALAALIKLAAYTVNAHPTTLMSVLEPACYVATLGGLKQDVQLAVIAEQFDEFNPDRDFYRKVHWQVSGVLSKS